MRLFVVVAFSWLALAPNAAQADIANIPKQLIEGFQPGLFIEQYISNMLSPIRRSGNDGMTLSEADLTQREEAAKASGIKSALIDFLRNDVNNDSSVTAEEIRQTIGSSRDMYPHGSEQAAQIDRRIEQVTKAVMALDADDNGAVSYAEMSKAATEQAQARGGRADFRELRALIALDPSGDGVLTAKELEDLARRAFATVDTDGNGKISREEYQHVSEAQQAAREQARRDEKKAFLRRQLENCNFGKLAVPDNLVVYAAGIYNARPTDKTVDDSGKQTGELDVIVDLPGQTVALILGAYEPTVWNIKPSKGTVMHSVIISGYENQKAEGLPPGVPLLVNSSRQHEKPCGQFFLSGTQLRRLNSVSDAAYKRPVKLFIPGRDDAGDILIDANSANPKMLPENAVRKRPREYSPVFENGSTTPNYKRIMHLQNVKLILKAVDDGIIRPATTADADAWMDALVEHELKTHALGVPALPVGKLPYFLPPAKIEFGNGFVVLKELVIPEGFSGQFIIPKGAPKPTGDTQRSGFFDMNTMTCSGTADEGREGIRCRGENW